MNPKPDRIVFGPAATGPLLLQNPLPPITWSVTITGPTGIPGDLIVRGEGALDPYRIFTITGGVDVTLKFFTISDGRARVGAGILNGDPGVAAGKLSLFKMVVRDNTATPISGEGFGDGQVVGGGISSSGDLVLDETQIISNFVQNDLPCSTPGPGIVCPFILGGAGVHVAGPVTDRPHAEIRNGSLFEGNVICPVGAGCASDKGPPPSDAVQYYGAGLFVYEDGEVLHVSGTAKIIQSTIRGNTINALDPGVAMSYRAHGAGVVGGCRDYINCLVFVDSTVSGNVINVTGIAEDGSTASAHGAAISVGGIGDDPGVELSIINTTIVHNQIISTASGASCTPDPVAGGCKSSGGAIWMKGVRAEIRWVTIAKNSIHFENGTAEGAGIQAPNVPPTILVLRSTLFADNTQLDTDEIPPTSPVKDNFVLTDFNMTTEGFNMFDDDPDEGEGIDDRISIPSCFDPLANYGGLTETMRPKSCLTPAGPLEDGGPADEITNDQRGLPRPPVGMGLTDVGAFECQLDECGTAGIGLPSGSFGSNSSDVSNESGSLFDQDRGTTMPAEAPSAPAKPVMVFGGSVVGRVLPVRPHADALWHDALLALGI